MVDHDVLDGAGAIVVLVPFTVDRQDHLDEWLRETRPHRGAHVHLVICHQDVPGALFNRGLVLNCGAAVIERELRLHPLARLLFWDVDLVPSRALMRRMLSPNPDAWPGTAVHWASGWTQRYAENYSGGCGGILGLSLAAFRAAGGWPSRFWGWGGEDEAMQTRVQRAGYRIQRAPGPDVRIFDLEDLTLDEKLGQLRKDGAKCVRKRENLASDRRHARPYADEIRAFLQTGKTARELVLGRRADPCGGHWVVRLG